MISVTGEPDLVRRIKARVNGSESFADVEGWESVPDDPDSVVLRLTIEGMMHEASSDRGYFHALCEVRRQLEPKEIFLICFGTDKYVYPSPMQESMGAAELAYRTTLGKPALTADIVNIFDEDPACNPSTIEDQEYFHQSWLASL